MSMQKTVTRRGFLQSAAVGLTAPFILPSNIWSAETKPNDKITMGFIGVGTQGGYLLGGFLGDKQTQVLAISDVDTTRREFHKKRVDDHYSKQAGSEYKGCAEYKDFREVNDYNNFLADLENVYKKAKAGG